jgi:hypothetical protein
MLALLSGCTASFEEARLVAAHRPYAAPTTDAQRLTCAGIDRARAWYGAGAAVASACTAGTGVPALVDIVDDRGLRTALQITMAVCAVTAGGLVILRDAAGVRWVADGCGQ